MAHSAQNMRKRGRWLARSLLGLLYLAPGPATAAETIDYAAEIKPILKQRCYACHGALKQKAGLRVDTAALLRRGGDSGPAVEPGKPDESELIDRVTQADAALRMPPEGAPLSAEQVALLRTWVEQGAKGPASEKPESDPRTHWAFQRPVRPPLPAAKASWVRNPIDAFLADEDQRVGVQALPPAEPHVLLRRVYLDLTGLPPTRAELRAFLDDPSDRAYEQVVDRLLASPQYGERWGRHWMDVWRYSDWYGRRAVPDVTNSYAMIWRWRDWIVRSLNEDQGYDRMVAAMLASDELEPTNDASAPATGFLLRNFYRWNYNTWMKDNVEHTAKAFLGLTFQCAHCHDHKYDPISHEDYFAFRAIFEPLEVRHDRVPGEPDPGPYPKYDYGKAYKPIASGLARIVDEKLDAETFLYTRGESRNIVPGRPPVPPGVPKFLGGQFRVEPVSLPAPAYYFGLRPFLRDEERRPREAAHAKALAAVEPAQRALDSAMAAEQKLQLDSASSRPVLAFMGRDDVPAFVRGPVVPPPALSSARGRVAAAKRALDLATAGLAVAAADLKALNARIVADDVRYGQVPGDGKALALSAARAEAALASARANLEKSVAESALAAPRSGPTAAPALPQAQAALDAAEKKVQAAAKTLANPGSNYTPLAQVFPARSTGRRSALARWITARENPLTARVAVNHIWRWHFHEPFVGTTADFGRNGASPQNQALLDWLAVELMEPSTPGAKPWSMKALHRLIVTSGAYRMASHTSAETSGRSEAKAPAPRRFPFARIEAEVVRDSVLLVAGALDRTMAGPDIPYEQGLTSRRRSLYFTHHGEARMPFLELFDAADACDAYKRTVTVVPQQALALANNELAQRLSRELADRIWDESAGESSTEASRADAFIIAAFEHVLSRRPTVREHEVALAFLHSGDTGGAAGRSRESLILALFNHNDFLAVH